MREACCVKSEGDANPLRPRRSGATLHTPRNTLHVSRFTLALTLLAHPAAATPATITAPLEVLKTKHIAVSVRVNGAGPFRLVLDTGSPISFLSGHAAEQS